MTNTTSISALTQAIEQASTSTPPLERWLDRSKELQRELSLRVVSLSHYIDELPETAYASYADALSSVLQDPELDLHMDKLGKKELQEFAKRLETHGYTDKAKIVREAVDALNP